MRRGKSSTKERRQWVGSWRETSVLYVEDFRPADRSSPSDFGRTRLWWTSASSSGAWAKALSAALERDLSSSVQLCTTTMLDRVAESAFGCGRTIIDRPSR